MLHPLLVLSAIKTPPLTLNSTGSTQKSPSWRRSAAAVRRRYVRVMACIKGSHCSHAWALCPSFRTRATLHDSHAIRVTVTCIDPYSVPPLCTIRMLHIPNHTPLCSDSRTQTCPKAQTQRTARGHSRARSSRRSGATACSGWPAHTRGEFLLRLLYVLATACSGWPARGEFR